MNKKELSGIFRHNVPPAEEGHREQLERQLLAAYDAQGIRPAHRRRIWVRFAPAMVVALTLLTTSQVPASYRIQVGKRITAEFPNGEPPETATKELARAVGMDAEGPRTVSIQLRRIDGGIAVLIANVWGDKFPPDALMQERMHALPELANAQISIVPLKGKIRGNVAELIGHHLFKAASTPEARELARQALIEELRREEGNDATIDVQVERDGEGERVRVKVLKVVPPGAKTPLPLGEGQGEGN